MCSSNTPTVFLLPNKRAARAQMQMLRGRKTGKALIMEPTFLHRDLCARAVQVSLQQLSPRPRYLRLAASPTFRP